MERLAAATGIATVASPLLAFAATPDFYVAPDGEDTNPGTVTAPFATFARARDAVRQTRAGPGRHARGPGAPARPEGPAHRH